jgi:hypothetical protein
MVKTRAIQFRVNIDQHTQIKANAKQTKFKSVSDFLRHVALLNPLDTAYYCPVASRCPIKNIAKRIK